ncbi:MAG TPA: hemolysin III family protein [Bacteroidales bacterium]|nr:hemolysin III family protein [Bacteroidales bacterium]
MSQIKTYTVREEKANYLTHAFGVLVAIGAAMYLIHKSVVADNGWAIFAYSIYGFGMLMCMLSSTLYHYVQEPKTKKILRHIDHGNIYLQIATSYSPVTLILLREHGIWGWLIFGLVWFFALVGILLNFRELKPNNNLKTLFYVVISSTIFIAIKPMIDVCITQDCVSILYWLIIGGVFYIAGTLFYASKKEFMHAIFHVFVLLGLISHIISASLIPL